MTFDCLSEAQEFNIYSWEVGFGTKKGDKYGRQCKNSNASVTTTCLIKGNPRHEPTAVWDF